MNCNYFSHSKFVEMSFYESDFNNYVNLTIALIYLLFVSNTSNHPFSRNENYKNWKKKLIIKGRTRLKVKRLPLQRKFLVKHLRYANRIYLVMSLGYFSDSFYLQIEYRKKKKKNFECKEKKNLVHVLS